MQLWGSGLPRQRQLLANFVVLLQKFHVLERVDPQLLFEPDMVGQPLGLQEVSPISQTLVDFVLLQFELPYLGLELGRPLLQLVLARVEAGLQSVYELLLARSQLGRLLLDYLQVVLAILDVLLRQLHLVSVRMRGRLKDCFLLLLQLLVESAF